MASPRNERFGLAKQSTFSEELKNYIGIFRYYTIIYGLTQYESQRFRLNAESKLSVKYYSVELQKTKAPINL